MILGLNIPTKHGSRPDRSPDFKIGTQNFYFKEMLVFNGAGVPSPLQFDSEGVILDFFDHQGDKYWIDCGDDVTLAYLRWKAKR